MPHLTQETGGIHRSGTGGFTVCQCKLMKDCFKTGGQLTDMLTVFPENGDLQVRVHSELCFATPLRRAANR